MCQNVSGDMFLVTFPCVYECFSGENNLEAHSDRELSFVCCGNTEDYKPDTFRITDSYFFYDMVA